MARAPTWTRSSGPDGALYVQTYDGFFRAGPERRHLPLRLHRRRRRRRARTRARSRSAATASRFSSARLGRRRPTRGTSATARPSTEANPTHTYAEAKRYTADADRHLRRRRARTPRRSPSTCSPRPTRRAADDHGHAEPGPAGQRRHLHAPRHRHADRDRRRRQRRRHGPSTASTAATWQELRRRRSGARSPATYTIEYRSTDRTGNVEATKSVTFTIAVPDNCTTNLNDEFDGTALDPKWTVLRPTPAALSFVDGALRIKVRDGDMIGGTRRRRRTCCCRTRPRASWQIHDQARRLDARQRGRAGRLRPLAASEDPNTFAKITYISRAPSRSTSGWRRATTRPRSRPGRRSPRRDGDVWLRVSADGVGHYIAEGSVNGEDWQQIAGADRRTSATPRR